MCNDLLVLYAKTLFLQSTLSQCSSRAAIADHNDIGYGLRTPYGSAGTYSLDSLDGAYGLGAWGIGSPNIEYSRTSGGGLAVSSGSAIAPIGLSVASENEYKGQLSSAGELPFVGTVGVEGVLPTTGAGAVNHHCGDGNNAIFSDRISGSYGLDYDAIFDRSVGLGFGDLGYRAGLARKGCACNIY